MLRPAVPLTYSLTMKACLRQHAMERPTFDQILELLRDVVKEVARGRYLDGDGRLQVCRRFRSPMGASHECRGVCM